jgi:cyclophilin family peptidyl-prolyl cis-trans isomerase
MLRLIALVLCLGMLVAACGGDDDPAGETAATPTATEEAAPAGCEAAEPPEPRPEGDLPKPKQQLEAGKTYVATVSTNCGDFEITLDAERAPKTGGSFKSLADKGFFDDTTFHRVSPGFVIQGGDPLGTGMGGPGYSVAEPPPQDLVYTKGVVAMAKTEVEPPGTSGSQFFVVTAEEIPLPPDYALLGNVTGGQEVVDTIAVVEVNGETPIEPVVVNSVKVAVSD